MTRCNACNDTGMRITYALYSAATGTDYGLPRRRVQEISKDEYARMRLIVDGTNQKAETAAKLCECEVGRRQRAAIAARESAAEEKAHRGSKRA
jgi:hypothetical protein